MEGPDLEPKMKKTKMTLVHRAHQAKEWGEVRGTYKETDLLVTLIMKSTFLLSMDKRSVLWNAGHAISLDLLAPSTVVTVMPASKCMTITVPGLAHALANVTTDFSSFSHWWQLYIPFTQAFSISSFRPTSSMEMKTKMSGIRNIRWVLLY